MSAPSRIVTPERRSSGVSAAAPIWRFVGIVLIFLFLWPPIFGIIAWWMKFDFGGPLAGMLATIAIYSYGLFAPSPLLAGMILAVAAVRFSYNSIFLVLVAAVAAALLVPILIVVMAPGPASLESLLDAPSDSYVIELVASLVASITCWRLARRSARST